MRSESIAPGLKHYENIMKNIDFVNRSMGSNNSQHQRLIQVPDYEISYDQIKKNDKLPQMHEINSLVLNKKSYQESEIFLNSGHSSSNLFGQTYTNIQPDISTVDRDTFNFKVYKSQITATYLRNVQIESSGTYTNLCFAQNTSSNNVLHLPKKKL